MTYKWRLSEIWIVKYEEDKKMNEKTIDENNVAKEYLDYRKQVLDYTNDEMNLSLDNEKQAYIAVFDIPMKSNIVGFQTQSLILIFGLNTHIYHGSGKTIVDLEKHTNVMKAMQSVLISSHQVLSDMQLVDDFEFYNSENVRVYLKTQKGIFYKELDDKENKINQFLQMLMNHVMAEIVKTGKLVIQ